jgi:hypothetical protein
MSKLYFFFRDELWKNGNTGYTRVELHNLAKQHILPLLLDEPDCWVGNVITTSTNDLTEHGWKLFLEEFKNWALSNFNISFF